MSWIQRANVRGPKGDEVKNPRLNEQGDLLLDEVQRTAGSPVTVVKNVGQIAGDSVENPRLNAAGELLVDKRARGAVVTENLGLVRGDSLENPRRNAQGELLVDRRVGATVTTINLGQVTGDSIANPRLSGDNLLVDRTVAGVTSAVTVGSIRGRKGDGYTSAVVDVNGHLKLTETNSSGTTVKDLGVVRGPQGLPGTNAVPTAEAIAANLELPGPARDALDSYMLPTMTREARAALADRIAAWMSATARNVRGDVYMQGTLRRMRIKKTSASAQTSYALSAEDEEPQATAAGLSLQYLAMYATVYPEKAQQVRPAVDRLIRTLESLQCYDPTVPQYGGFMSAAGSSIHGAFGTGQAVRGLILAYKRYGVGQWLEMAKLGGTFLRTLINPNVKYMALYGVNVIDVPANTYVMCDQIDGGGKLHCSAYVWNLVGVHAMYELGWVTGDASWISDAEPVRDFMAQGFLTYNEYFGTKAHADGLAAGRVDQGPTGMASAPAGTNAWQRDGQAVGKGTIGSDAMEYGLTALWHSGYNVAALKTAYEYLAGLQMSVITSTATTAFKDAYNATNRLICWPGFFRINDPEFGGVSEAWGGYLDAQGAGELLEWKQAYYPSHYALTLPIIRAIVEPDRGALLDENFQSQWSTETGGVFATQGTLPIAATGIGLLSTNPEYNLEVTA